MSGNQQKLHLRFLLNSEDSVPHSVFGPKSSNGAQDFQNAVLSSSHKKKFSSSRRIAQNRRSALQVSPTADTKFGKSRKQSAGTYLKGSATRTKFSSPSQQSRPKDIKSCPQFLPPSNRASTSNIPSLQPRNALGCSNCRKSFQQQSMFLHIAFS